MLYIFPNPHSYKGFKYSIGGSGLNSSRILAAMGRKELLFFGAIGEDQNGKIVKEILKRSSVDSRLASFFSVLFIQELFLFRLQEFKEIQTGTCLCLCNGEDRSLTANIGAALILEKSFIETNIKVFDSVNQLYYYIEGFFIPEKMHICRFLYEKFSTSPSNMLITNLNAPYIVRKFPKDITWLIKKADIVFGNRDEFEELAAINGYEVMEDLLSDLLNEYTSVEKNKTIIVTDGKNPVFFYKGNATTVKSGQVNVPQVNSAEICDTTGAGDSFVAGFIRGIMEGKATRECIELGCEISAQVIKVVGCNLPKNFNP